MNTSAQSVAARVTALPKMPMKELWGLWDHYFQRRPSHNNRDYVEARVAYKLQEESFGGLRLETRQQMIKIGASQSKMNSRRVTEVHVVPGTILVREYDDREHRVLALADGVFEYDGKTFKSLSAAARHITGTSISGPLFFGLIKNERRKK